MIFRTTPENVAQTVAPISNLTPEKLVEDFGLRAHELGAELDNWGKYDSFPAWIKERIAEKFALYITTVDGKPVWSDDKCPACGEALGIHPNLAPDSNKHMKCAWARAESLTHDDSKECGAVAPRRRAYQRHRERVGRAQARAARRLPSRKGNYIDDYLGEKHGTENR